MTLGRTVRRLLLGLGLALGVIACGSVDSAGEAVTDQEEAAIAVAEAWLATVDAEGYSESWDQAADLFQRAVSREAWERSLRSARQPLGTLVSRKLVSKQFLTELPGAPDGEYVVIQFSSSFANKRAAVETVTPMLEGSGVWKVSGYYIK